MKHTLTLPTGTTQSVERTAQTELIFDERHYRKVGEKIVGQQRPPRLTGVWEMKWRHVAFRPVVNWDICAVLDKGLDPWANGFAPRQ